MTSGRAGGLKLGAAQSGFPPTHRACAGTAGRCLSLHALLCGEPRQQRASESARTTRAGLAATSSGRATPPPSQNSGTVKLYESPGKAGGFPTGA